MSWWTVLFCALRTTLVPGWLTPTLYAVLLLLTFTERHLWSSGWRNSPLLVSDIFICLRCSLTFFPSLTFLPFLSFHSEKPPLSSYIFHHPIFGLLPLNHSQRSSFPLHCISSLSPLFLMVFRTMATDISVLRWLLSLFMLLFLSLPRLSRSHLVISPTGHDTHRCKTQSFILSVFIFHPPHWQPKLEQEIKETTVCVLLMNVLHLNADHTNWDYMLRHAILKPNVTALNNQRHVYTANWPKFLQQQWRWRRSRIHLLHDSLSKQSSAKRLPSCAHFFAPWCSWWLYLEQRYDWTN